MFSKKVTWKYKTWNVEWATFQDPKFISLKVSCGTFSALRTLSYT